MVYFIHKKKVVGEFKSILSSRETYRNFNDLTKIGVLVDDEDGKTFYKSNHKIDYSQEFVDIVNNYKIEKRLNKLNRVK